MPIGAELLKKLNRKYEPSTGIDLKFKNYDLHLVTDSEGNAVQLFLGKIGIDGRIKGDRYRRTLQYDREGKLIKDHWERKGKAT